MVVFFPNSPYIITDLFHLVNLGEMPLWFDLAFLFSFSWKGLILGFFSLMQVHHVLIIKFGETKIWVLIALLQLLCAYGIYLRRFERYNCWDIVTNPQSLFAEIAGLIASPLAHPKTIGVTAIFSLVLMLSYLTLYFISYHPRYEKQ
jgi:uncharacterized membrane protein